jgi:hypothetical protein
MYYYHNLTITPDHFKVFYFWAASQLDSWNGLGKLPKRGSLARQR